MIKRGGECLHSPTPARRATHTSWRCWCCLEPATTTVTTTLQDMFPMGPTLEDSWWATGVRDLARRHLTVINLWRSSFLRPVTMLWWVHTLLIGWTNSRLFSDWSIQKYNFLCLVRVYPSQYLVSGWRPTLLTTSVSTSPGCLTTGLSSSPTVSCSSSPSPPPAPTSGTSSWSSLPARTSW